MLTVSTRKIKGTILCWNHFTQRNRQRHIKRHTARYSQFNLASIHILTQTLSIDV